MMAHVVADKIILFLDAKVLAGKLDKSA